MIYEASRENYNNPITSTLLDKCAKERKYIQSNLPYATTQNVKPRWSLTRGSRLQEVPNTVI